jgi:hypothetical protein
MRYSTLPTPAKEKGLSSSVTDSESLPCSVANRTSTVAVIDEGLDVVLGSASTMEGKKQASVKKLPKAVTNENPRSV